MLKSCSDYTRGKGGGLINWALIDCPNLRPMLNSRRDEACQCDSADVEGRPKLCHDVIMQSQWQRRERQTCWCRVVRFGPKAVRLAPNRTKLGFFSENISVHFGLLSQKVLKSVLKSSRIVTFGANLTQRNVGLNLTSLPWLLACGILRWL